MTYGIEGLTAAIRKAIKEVDAIMTEDFKASLQEACTSFSNVANNPQVTLALRSFNRICTDHNIKTTRNFLKACTQVLRAIDPALVNEGLASISTLVNSIESSGVIENINTVVKNVLDSGPTVNRLFKLAEYLVLPAKIGLFGIGGLLVGSALCTAIECYRKSANSTTIDNLVRGQLEQIYISIRQLEMNAANLILSQDNLKYLEREEDRRLLAVSINNARRILRAIKPMNQFDEMIFRKMTNRLYEALLNLYIHPNPIYPSSEYQAPDESESLDLVTKTIDYYKVFEYLHEKNLNILFSVEEIQFPSNKLNYLTCKALYDNDTAESIIDRIMLDFARYYREQGVDSLYYATANMMCKSSHLFITLMLLAIESDDFSAFDNEDLRHFIQPLSAINDAHNLRINFVSRKWAEYTSGLQQHGLQLPIEACEIISNRALLKCVSEELKCFSYMRSLPRQVGNGIWDVPSGYKDLILHPIKTVSGVANLVRDSIYLPYGLIRGRNLENNSLIALKDAIINHPFRFITQIAVSAGCSYAISSGYSRLMRYGNAAMPTESVINSATSLSAEAARKSEEAARAAQEAEIAINAASAAERAESVARAAKAAQEAEAAVKAADAAQKAELATKATELAKLARKAADVARKAYNAGRIPLSKATAKIEAWQKAAQHAREATKAANLAKQAAKAAQKAADAAQAADLAQKAAEMARQAAEAAKTAEAAQNAAASAKKAAEAAKIAEITKKAADAAQKAVVTNKMVQSLAVAGLSARFTGELKPIARDRFFSNARHSESARPTSTESLANLVNYFHSFEFKGYRQIQIEGDGDCGYTGLGITRDEAYSLLIASLAEVADFLHPVVSELLLTEEFYRYLTSNEYLDPQITKEYIWDHINTFSKDLNIQSAFLEFDVREKRYDFGWVHPATLQALAHIMKVSLYIWELKQDQSLCPHREGRYAFSLHQEATQRIDLLFVNGNHYNRLEFYGYPNGFPKNDDDTIKPIDIESVQSNFLQPVMQEEPTLTTEVDTLLHTLRVH